LSDKRLVSAQDMARKVAAAARAVHSLKIIARTDAVASEGLDAAIARARLYVEAGAHAIFPEALTSAADLRTFAAAVRVPLLANMTEFGKTPLLPADELARLGYKMVIWPVTSLRVAARAMEECYAVLAATGTQTALLERMQSRCEQYDVIGYHDYEALDSTIAASIVPEGTPKPPANTPPAQPPSRSGGRRLAS